MHGWKWPRFLCRGIEIDLILEWRSKWTWFQWQGRNYLRPLCRGSNLAWFSIGIGIDLVFCGGRKLLGFSVWIEIHVAFVSRHQGWLGVWIEVDQMSVFGRNYLGFSMGNRISLGFCVGGRNWLDFSVEYRTWLDFSLGIGIDLVLCGGRKILGFSVCIEINLVLCRGTKVAFILVWGSNLTSVQRWV